MRELNEYYVREYLTENTSNEWEVPFGGLRDDEPMPSNFGLSIEDPKRRQLAWEIVKHGLKTDPFFQDPRYTKLPYKPIKQSKLEDSEEYFEEWWEYDRKWQFGDVEVSEEVKNYAKAAWLASYTLAYRKANPW